MSSHATAMRPHGLLVVSFDVVVGWSTPDTVAFTVYRPNVGGPRVMGIVAVALAPGAISPSCWLRHHAGGVGSLAGGDDHRWIEQGHGPGVLNGDGELAAGAAPPEPSRPLAVPP